MLIISDRLNNHKISTSIKQLLCISFVGKQLQAIGMPDVMDSILNHIVQNCEKGRSAFILMGEIYIPFQREYSETV